MATDHLSDSAISPNPSTVSSSNSTDSIILITLPIATKLTNSNYLAWQLQILPILHGYNLSKFIKSAPPSPTRTSNSGQIEVNPEFLHWRRQDQLLLGWIRSSLTESIQAQVVSCSSTMDLWIALQKQFASTSSSRRLDLKRQLQACHEDTLSCSEYLHNLRRIADELAFIGSPIPEEDLVMHTIQGLGTEFNPIAAAVNTASHHMPFSFSDLHGLLLGHEALLNTQIPSPAPSAFYTGNGSSNNSKNKPANPNSGYRPTNPPSRYGPRPSFRPNSQFQNQQPNGNRISCQICFKSGHTANICYRRYDPDSDWAPNPRFQAFTAQTHQMPVQSSSSST